MRLTRLQTLAAADALEAAEGEVLDVTIDGKTITDLAELTALANAIEAYEPGKVAELIDRRAEWIAKKLNATPKSKLMKKVVELRDRLMQTRIGKKIDAFVKTDPELAEAKKAVAIRYADGRMETRQVPVLDVGRSLALQRFSIAWNLLGFIPFIPLGGVIIPAAATLSSLVGAGAAFIKGDRDMAKVWVDIAKKHVVMGATKTGALALIEDLNDIDDLKKDQPL